LADGTHISWAEADRIIGLTEIECAYIAGLIEIGERTCLATEPILLDLGIIYLTSCAEIAIFVR
jgi:hypothetical protein